MYTSYYKRKVKKLIKLYNNYVFKVIQLNLSYTIIIGGQYLGDNNWGKKLYNRIYTIIGGPFLPFICLDPASH